MGELDFASARTVAARVRAKEVSPVEVLDHCLARVDALNDADQCGDLAQRRSGPGESRRKMATSWCTPIRTTCRRFSAFPSRSRT